MLGIFQQVMHQLGISQCKSSAYHPQSHQTLKTMMRTYCFDKNWDKGVHLLLFAVCESIQDNLPFELAFGHSVRGPLKMLEEAWLSNKEPSSVNLLEHVVTFRHLLQACELARQNLQRAQSRMKVWYDKRSRERNFKAGAKVLVLLPLPGYPLQARYHDPYVVEHKVGAVDYVVVTPDYRKKQQFCHINMLKEYYEEYHDDVEVCAVVVTSDQCKPELEGGEGESDCLSDTGVRLNNLEILNNKLDHLSDKEASDLKYLILEYTQLFPDTPMQTSLLYHDVDVDDAKPIKQPAYRVNPQKSFSEGGEVYDGYWTHRT